jgi:hypothetical protein
MHKRLGLDDRTAMDALPEHRGKRLAIGIYISVIKNPRYTHYTEYTGFPNVGYAHICCLVLMQPKRVSLDSSGGVVTMMLRDERGYLCQRVQHGPQPVE